MKSIEKTTRDGDIQIFEILTSRKELREWLRDEFWNCLYSEYKTSDGIFDLDDDSVDFYDKDGNYHGFRAGDPVKRFNVSNIKKLVSQNSATTVIYGDVRIIYNDHYGDWEVDFSFD